MTEATTTPPLKRCPFCGGKAGLGKGLRAKVAHSIGDWLWKPSIGCRKCDFARKFDSAEAAIEWWNKRTETQ